MFNYLLKNQTLMRKAKVDTCQKNILLIYLVNDWICLNTSISEFSGKGLDEGVVILTMKGALAGRRGRSRVRKGSDSLRNSDGKFAPRPSSPLVKTQIRMAGRNWKLRTYIVFYVMVSLKVYVDFFSLL